jgi:tetratricopeptide (TPR) repeat protein
MGARRLLEESISEARSVGDRWCLADALGTLGSILPLQGELEMAEAMSREALRVAGEAHDDQGRRMALFGIALTVSRRGDHEETLAAAEEGLRISRAIGDAWFVSYFLWLLAMTAAERGETEPAKQRAEEALLVARQLQGPLLIVCALEAVAAAAISVGDAAGARSALVEARDVGEHGGVPGSYVSSVVRLLGELDSEAGRPDEATALFAQATELAQRVGDTWGLARTLTARGRAAAREGRRFDARRMFAESLSTARALTAWAAMAEAMDGYAATCLPEEASLAANLLGGADQLRGRLGAPRPPWLSPEDRRTREMARSTLGEEAFALELKRDWATTVEEVTRLGSPHRD